MKKSKGFAKVEFIANLQKIKELTQKGYTKRYIYDHLYDEGKITMTYIHFCRFNLYGNISNSKNSPSLGVPAIRTVSGTPALPDNGGGGSYSRQQENDSSFSLNNKVTSEDLDELT